MLRDDMIALSGGPRLALRRADGPRRPFLLVHGLSSNARLWDGVALRLAGAGHEVAAVDLRGHGRSERTTEGYDTATAAADLAALCGALGWRGSRAPIAAGQSWGGNVVLTLAAEHRAVAGLALVDGGWIHLRSRFADFDDCWEVLAPPAFDGVTLESFASRLSAMHADWPEAGRIAALGNVTVADDGTVRPNLLRDHHRSILRSLWETDPAPLYARVSVPALLMPAVPAVPGEPTPATAAAEAIPGARISWYVGAHHDLHAQQPDRCADDLLALAGIVDAEAVA